MIKINCKYLFASYCLEELKETYDSLGSHTEVWPISGLRTLEAGDYCLTYGERAFL